ncbi:MAG: alanine--tRNA ligase [Bacteroidota bacterium]|jgi:alanyl-tRNA synthetase
MPMTAAEIRKAFLDFFASKEHTIVPSAPVVLKNDPTLKFTNSGMNQFKDYFLGNATPPYKRAADTQKCLRVSGKHNDLEEVGVDTYHHTFFEMLGNWSFGDYFKQEALTWSWELLTEVYKIPKDRLYVSVFEGDAAESLPPSKIALEVWKGLVPEDRIIFGKKKDNFWEMGDTGPCGPCSEIHVDMRPDDERAQVPGRDLVNDDHPQVIEIWNNVFMQYNRKKDRSLEPLPATHVDTGMGFERLVRVLQGKSSNYDTDIFVPTIQLTEKITSCTYDGSDSKVAVAFRVIADHIRAISFAIADGQLPSNTDAGYVIRRILRRAVRYYYSYLNYKQPLLHQLVALKAAEFADVFPELKQQEAFVAKIILEEEQGFLRTLESGLKRLDEVMATSTDTIDGARAFELYDTFGFPKDLTELIAAEHNLKIDDEGFNAAMAVQKQKAKAATALDVDDWVVLQEHSDAPKFVGYTSHSATAQVMKYRKVKSKGKEQYQIVLTSTPFYAESGGQIGDTGSLENANGKIVITDTKKENDTFVHFADEVLSDMSGDFTASIDAARRQKITLHHTATHLLQAAMQRVLGSHVAQKGSLNAEGNLRFDFSHFAKVSNEEIASIEEIVNAKIRENIPVVIKELPKDEALKLGAMALFGEKYGDVVRVVIIDEKFSVELCGGTHVSNTGELGFFKVLSESAIAAGVRRIEAVTGSAAEQFLNTNLQALASIKEQFKNPKDLLKAVQALADEKTALQKQLDRMEARMLVGVRNDLLTKQKSKDGINLISEIVEVSSGDALRKLCTDLKNELAAPYFVALAANVDGKPHIAVLIEEALSTSKQLNAAALIKEHAAPLIKGGGGGQATLATAGGQDASNLGLALERLVSSVGV